MLMLLTSPRDILLFLINPQSEKTGKELGLGVFSRQHKSPKFFPVNFCLFVFDVIRVRCWVPPGVGFNLGEKF